MISKSFWVGVLIFTLGFLPVDTEAQTGSKKIVSTGTIIGVIIAVAAAVAIIAVVVVRKSSEKRTITGCVNSEPNGMSLTDDKDNRSYDLSGNGTGIKAGDRMTLQVKKVKSKNAGKTPVWEAKRVTKDFGLCHP